MSELQKERESTRVDREDPTKKKLPVSVTVSADDFGYKEDKEYREAMRFLIRKLIEAAK